VLGDVLAPLGQAVYEVVAAPAILHRKVRSHEELENWRARGSAAADRLKELRLRVRYSLWGLDEGLRVLSRVPDWISNFQGRPDEGERLLLQASDLRDELDRVLRKSYGHGRPPKRRERKRVLNAADRLRATWDGIPRKVPEASDEEPLA
jgi:hypothetical protein